MAKRVKALFYDFLGVFFSVLCAVHCMMLPLVLVLFPSVSEVLHSPWIHFFFLAVISVIFFRSFPYGRTKTSTFCVASTGLFALYLGWVFELVIHADPIHSSLVGSALLVIAHILNILETHSQRAQLKTRS